jgi:hypothetical protein
MKYIKTFESLNIDEPQVGDYVICKETQPYKLDYNYNTDTNTDITKLNTFFNDNIGKILKRFNNGNYLVKFKYVPNHLVSKFSMDDERLMMPEEIIYHSNNIKDIEQMQMNINKYNL